MQMGLPVGAILAISLTAIVSSVNGGLEQGAWRYLFMIGALPVFIMSVVAWFTPESQVWLARQQGKAKRTQPASKLGKHNLERPAAGFRLYLLYSVSILGVFTWTPTYLREVKHLDFLHSLKFVLALQVGAIAGFLVFSVLADKWGRRPMFLIYLLTGAIAVALYLL